MNYEEELLNICKRKKNTEIFFEEKGVKDLKNYIKRIAIQNENLTQDYMEEIYKISNKIEKISLYMQSKIEDEEIRERRIIKDLEVREKRFVKSLVSILDNIKYIYDFSLKTNNEILSEDMGSLFNIVKKSMVNVDILLIDGMENFFDESLHECVGTIWDNERKDYEIAEVLKVGYIYKGKIERSAQVVVVKNKEDIVDGKNNRY
ncbi:nucleotide exchange factor GrpE [Clostridium sp.]|uniref:nucleotide exchange factor GrpE n=1 Tax=Clostridium sp. TaxID=1506 RepID=UPI0026101372|nr:nucleotide exchange factor GrpE [Clostridium sp.]